MKPTTKTKKKVVVKQPSARTLKIKVRELTNEIGDVRDLLKKSKDLNSQYYSALCNMENVAKHLHRENERHFNKLQEAENKIKDYEATIRVLSKNENIGFIEQGKEILPSLEQLKKRLQYSGDWKDESMTPKTKSE